MESKKFLELLVSGNCKAYNLPNGVKKVWSNQYGKGYVFPDGSYFVHYNKSLGIFNQNLTTGKTFNFWCFVAYGDHRKTLYRVVALKYEVNQ